jgi:hypothetical protein
MAGLFHTRTWREPTEPLVINCPACQAQHVTAETYIYFEQLRILLVIPLPPNRSYWLTCPSCRSPLLSRFPAYELRGLPPEAITHFIRHRVSPIRKFLAILGIMFFFWPLLGLMVTGPAVLANFRTQGWTKRLSWIAFILSLVAHLFMLFILVMDESTKHTR